MMLPRGDAVALAEELIRVDSRNPALASGGPGEGPIARRLGDILGEWGLNVRLQDAAPGRPNVVAVLEGSGGGRSLMFNGHLDVVGVDGMSHPPFDAIRTSGRLYGRGASDMKGGVAAMCAAAAQLNGSLKGDLIVAAVVDEEWKSAGTSALLASGLRADAAIVTEPTGLRLMPAHRGFAWIELRVRGRAAHGSRWDIGIDAIRHAGLLLAELDRYDDEDLPARAHPLLGRPSVHAGTIEGGLGLSTYPDSCVLRIERRTIPGESVEEVRAQLRQCVQRVQRRQPRFECDVEILFAQPPSDVPAEAPIVRELSDLLVRHHLSATPAGMSAWTDAALLNAAGIPAICFGPGDMGLAHAAEEYIEVSEVQHATELLVDLARRWCN